MNNNNNKTTKTATDSLNTTTNSLSTITELNEKTELNENYIKELARKVKQEGIYKKDGSITNEGIILLATLLNPSMLTTNSFNLIEILNKDIK